MAGTFFKENYLKVFGIQPEVPLRPDFVVSVYPVVSMQDSLAHLRSRKNLIGESFTKEQIDKFSMELQVQDDMPPFFLITAKDDPVVNYKNSVLLDKALTNKNINHTFLLYEKGGHGYGMDEKKGGEAARWNVVFKEWLIKNGFIKE
jgi:acetyl esterase/lipase